MKRNVIILLGVLALVIVLIFLFAKQQKLLKEDMLESIDMKNFKITSSAFKEGEKIPVKYTCDGAGVSPPLKIENVPKGTESMILVLEDPDAPVGLFVHWFVWNIPPHKTEIFEGEVLRYPVSRNDVKKFEYLGPCPPSGTHRYFFKVYALDREIPLSEGSSKEDVKKEMKGHVIDEAYLMGTYSRSF